MTDTDRQTAMTVDVYEQFARDLECGDFGNVSGALNSRMCCDGQMCGCRGSTVGEYLAYELRTASVRITGDKDRETPGRAPPPDGPVTVTQGDREVAAPLYWGESPPHTERIRQEIIDGKFDHIGYIQAIARHRIAAERAAYAAGQRDMRERAAEAMNGSPIKAPSGWDDEQVEWHETGQIDAANSFRHAIRALPIKETE